ncbi:hypothetical protein F-LCD7_0211 [Faustovirus]|nr:hypothetical protein F-LCD7_0211 [Faustovirus]QJX72971.1 GIY-YIG catalytic domain-containing endonuclease [Faustovirus]QJX73476.1 GIY-YIG catalytic domain-containing endonuclease [Faustovirus]SMH63248.1 GIY-YIG catalytic domain-containing endonuclease [Faustovirus]
MSDLIGFSIFEKQEENLKRDLKPGFIYLITDPNGKVYIGQTTKAFNVRMGRHVYDCKRGKGCPSLGKAIETFGWDKLTKEVLFQCNARELNMYEKKFIALYDAANPDKGYNLTLGGSHGKGCAESVRKVLSDKRRVNTDYELPVGIRHVIDKRRKDEGFRVRIETQGTEEYIFMGKDYSMEEKLALAKECREILLRGDKYVKKPMRKHKEDEDLPAEIITRHNPNGTTFYRVKIPNSTKCKHFMVSYKTDAERKAAALAYHASKYNNNN